MANKIAQHALENNLIKELKNSDLIKPEVFFNKETRFDFLIEKNKQKSFVEVKNVTLFRNKDTAEFPDAVTARGTKHLLTLIVSDPWLLRFIASTRQGCNCWHIDQIHNQQVLQ